MNKTVTFFWLVFLFSCMCNLKSVFSKEPVHSNYKGKYTADIKNYEIVVPQRVNKDGSFISHLVSHHHNKRSTKGLESIFYKIPIEGEDYLIELTPNLDLISPGAVVEIHKDEARFANQSSFHESSSNENIGKLFRNLDIKKLKNTGCHFLGHVKGENISKAALSTCYGLNKAGIREKRKKNSGIHNKACHGYKRRKYREFAMINRFILNNSSEGRLGLVSAVCDDLNAFVIKVTWCEKGKPCDWTGEAKDSSSGTWDRMSYTENETDII